ncbi:MAG: DUF2442 domain-containing protein [Tannerella sp.]|jgi:hypothetical protein|nr:DUF2442 domain-containing protein [Tannerella sp.]
MNPKIIKVKPENNYILRVWFANGEEGSFDVKPYLDKGIFRELRDVAIFNSVHPDGLSIEWDNEAALCPDTVYLNSVKA